MLFFQVVCRGCVRYGTVCVVVVRLVCGGGGLPWVVGAAGGAIGAWSFVVCVPAWEVLLLAQLGLGRCGVAFPVFLGCLSWCAPCGVVWLVFAVWVLLVV